MSKSRHIDYKTDLAPQFDTFQELIIMLILKTIRNEVTVRSKRGQSKINLRASKSHRGGFFSFQRYNTMMCTVIYFLFTYRGKTLTAVKQKYILRSHLFNSIFVVIHVLPIVLSYLLSVHK